jgi:hypothetical protein
VQYDYIDIVISALAGTKEKPQRVDRDGFELCVEGQETGLGYWVDEKSFDLPLYYCTVLQSGGLLGKKPLPTEHLAKAFLQELTSADWQIDWKKSFKDQSPSQKSYILDVVKDVWNELVPSIFFENAENTLRHLFFHHGQYLSQNLDREYYERLLKTLDLVALERQKENEENAEHIKTVQQNQEAEKHLKEMRKALQGEDDKGTEKAWGKFASVFLPAMAPYRRPCVMSHDIARWFCSFRDVDDDMLALLTLMRDQSGVAHLLYMYGFAQGKDYEMTHPSQNLDPESSERLLKTLDPVENLQQKENEEESNEHE